MAYAVDPNPSNAMLTLEAAASDVNWLTDVLFFSVSVSFLQNTRRMPQDSPKIGETIILHKKKI